MRFWKKCVRLRSVLIFAFFVIGLVMVLTGWSMTGQFAGLGLMLLGIVLLLTALLLYNKGY